MPFAVANYCHYTSPHRCTGVRYGIHACQLPDRIISLDHYYATPEARECSTFDRPQGFYDKTNFTGKKASRRDRF